jgi:hypothetical protein
MREHDVERKAAAEREADKRAALDPQRVEHSDGVVDRRELLARRLGAAPEAQVVTDRPEPVRERGRLRPEQAIVAEAAVQKQHGGALAYFFDPKTRAVHLDVRHRGSLRLAEACAHESSSSSSFTHGRSRAPTSKRHPHRLGGAR